MIVTKSILFFFALIFSIHFIVDLILRIIGEIKQHQTGDEWHTEFVHGHIKPLAHADKLILMIVAWTSFYVMYQLP